MLLGNKYLCCAKYHGTKKQRRKLANIAKLSSILLCSCENSCQTWPEYFAHNRLSSARCVLLFSCQKVKHLWQAYPCFRVWIFCQNVCRPWPDLFRAKTLVVREMRFAGFAPKITSYAMVRHHLQRLLSNGAISRLSVLNVSLSLLSRSTWLGTPLVRTSMETEGPFSPLTPWRRQMLCVHELVSWSKVNSSEYHTTV